MENELFKYSKVYLIWNCLTSKIFDFPFLEKKGRALLCKDQFPNFYIVTFRTLFSTK